MANILLDHSNPPSPSLMYSSPSSSLSDSLDDPFMDYIQANDHDNSNDFYSVAHSDGMPSPPPPPSHDQACFQNDQIIMPEGDLPKVEQADVFDLISTSSSHAIPSLARKCLSFESLKSLSTVDTPVVTAKNPSTFSDLQIRVLGIPNSGAKSRVETQIKLCIQLVTDRGDKVPLWSHLKLPEHLVAKEKYKRVNQTKNDSGASVPLNDGKLLTLEATVKCFSDPLHKVETCIGCIRRERRRSQRKKENKQKRDVPDSLPPSPTSSSGKDAATVDDNNVSPLEKCRVLLFNCTEIMDFSSGDCILPTRITCYCRHHNEKVGFCIHFTMRNSRNQIVAQGVSPAIMITDDHKSSKSTRKRSRAEFEFPPTSSNPETPAVSRRPSPQRQLSASESSSPTTPVNPSPPVPILPRSPKYAKVEQDLNMTPVNSTAFMSIPHDQDLDHESSPQHPLTAVNNNPSFQALLEGNVPALNDTPVMMHPENRHRQMSLQTAAPLLQQQALMTPRRRRTVNSYHSAGAGLLSAIQRQASGSPTSVPQLNRLIPSEGPLYGGIEVTVLGSGFYEGLVCLFGETPALPTHCWSQNTLVCILPPATTAGTVVVSFKEHPLVVDGQDIVLFTYYDESDRALMELALQVVGLKMTGKLEDARQIAMRIVQGDHHAGNTTTGGQQHGSGLEAQIIQALDNVKDLHTSYDLLVSQVNKQDHTMLHLAAMLGFTELTSMLVQLGADVDAQDRNGMTALHFASWTGKHDIVKILLDQGDAHPSVRSIHGKTPIDLAASSHHIGIVDTLHWYEMTYAESDSISAEEDEEDDRVVGWLSNGQKEIGQYNDDENIFSALTTSDKMEPIKPHEPQEPARPKPFSDLTAWMQRSFGNKHKASLIPNSYPPTFLSGNSKLTTDEETSLWATAWYLAIASMMNSSPTQPQDKIPSHFVPMDMSIPGAALSPKNVIDLGDLDEEDFDDDHLRFHQDTRLQLFWLPLLLLMIAVLVCQFTEVDPVTIIKTSIRTQLLAQ
ncbi:hypothetical protein INT44_006342 [Umbelopsis vinacea]|uniref:IPT/TIG domain-containing protein n=1 Tax=Umbelopsis vinacea TaxID=44442 RepID=A0A8H7UBJ5_9FUNG|nr:hypothetical protein INT44_006342 [Umbelopsis vinacea]